MGNSNRIGIVVFRFIGISPYSRFYIWVGFWYLITKAAYTKHICDIMQ